MTETSYARDIQLYYVSVGMLVKVVIRHKIRKGVSCNLTHHGHNPTSDYGRDEMQYVCTRSHTKQFCYI